MSKKLASIQHIKRRIVLNFNNTVRVYMKIGELARCTGLSERMLRYYEHEGLLEPARSESGYRDYSHADAQAAYRIRMLVVAGFKIETIRIILPCMLDNQSHFAPCKKVQEALKKEVEKLDKKLSELTKSRAIIASILERVEMESSTWVDPSA
ncbi:MerR family transcriptional regulator [Yersinia kristensenii]|uniref:MerR family transcriptional regulator n=1 Tax=Yersinia kristensenii TaxID=28152 RepID=UPI0021558A22|nr:MerR family transcriptional regulator [Yersinia kristensenii]